MESDDTYSMRKVSSLSLGSVLKKPWAHLIRNTVNRCTQIEYLSSTFFNYHLLKLLKDKKIGKNQKYDDDFFSNKNKVRPFFVMICKGCHSKDIELNESLVEWIDMFQNSDNSLPTSNGLNTILTKLFERYYVAFKNYNNIAIVNHYSWFLSNKYDITKRSSQKLSKVILEKLMSIKSNTGLDTEDNIDNQVDLNSVEKNIFDNQVQSIANQYDLKSFSERIRFHYYIQTELDVSTTDHKSFSISPICSLKTTFISICANKTLKNLYDFAISCIKTGKHTIFGLNLDLLKEIETIGEPTQIIDVMIDNKKLCRQQKLRHGYTLSPEFKTNGIENIIMYEKTFQKTKQITQKEFDKKNKERMEKEEIKKNSTDKRVTRVQYPPIQKDKKVYPSTDTFDSAKSGYFAKTSLKNSKIEIGTPIVSIDPGHKNILTCANFKYDNNIDNIIFTKGYTLSLGEYYHKIGNKRMRYTIEKKKKKQNIDEIEAEWSRHSLKTSNLELLRENMRIQLNSWNKISTFYRKTEHCRMRFDCKQK